MLLQIQKLGGAINEAQKRGDHRECLSLALEFLSVLEETLERPHQFYAMSARTVATALWALHGSKCEEWADQQQQEG